MSAPRKLQPDAEAALINWYAKYLRAVDRLRRIGTVRTKAREVGLSPQGLWKIVNRAEVELRRKCKVAGIEQSKVETTPTEKVKTRA